MRLLAAYLVSVVLVLAGGCRPTEDPPDAKAPAPPAGADARGLLTDADMPALADTVTRLWRGERPRDVPLALARPSEGVYVVVRARGRRVHHLWKLGGTVLEGLAEGLADARVAALRKGDADAVDAVEIDVARSFRHLDIDSDAAELLANNHRGVRGLLVELPGGPTLRYAPTLMLATNHSFRLQIDRLLTARVQQDGLSVQSPRGQRAAAELRANTRFGQFDAQQVLVRLGEPATATLMHRGNEIVPPEAVTQAATERLARLMEDWLTGAVQRDGRLVYKYWPSRAEESRSNNMIRQWMSTVALGKIAAAHPERTDLWPLVSRNIEHNLARYYTEEDGHGLILHADKVKLGAVALAALALVGHPERARWARQERALRRTVDSLWNDDGRFASWYRAPPGTREQQNFYPGEALVLWATLYAEERDPKLLAKILRSFDHYRAWHLDERNRNPAFVPWHTQAYCTLWSALEGHARRHELRSFVFEMNDWLLGLQQWETAPYPDCRGRFYDPARSHFGPPHASATGVYLEGLVDACRLAREVGDSARADAYRRAIVRATRSLAQLQFQDDVDMYYVHDRARVRGGLRTTVYDNEIRNDNVQHGLMGILEVLELFDDGDYRAE